MKPSLLFFWIFFPAIPCLYASGFLRAGDVRTVGRGGNEATASALFNPSLVALMEHNTVRINYFNRYGLKESGLAGAGIYLPGGALPLGVEISSFGYDSYRESLFRLAAAKRLNARWALGISIQYALLQTELYEEQPGRLSADAGLTYAPCGSLLAGVFIVNWPSAAFAGEEAAGGFLIQAGLQWEVAGRVFLSAALETDGFRSAGAGVGLEYAPPGDFSIRAGVRGSPLLPSFGFGYCFSVFSFDVAAVFHPVLGASTGVGFSFSF
jgi:hypothetical protein